MNDNYYYALVGLIIVSVIAFWGGIAYVAFHFMNKWW